MVSYVEIPHILTQLSTKVRKDILVPIIVFIVNAGLHLGVINDQ